jgi:hypothetical protein
MAAIFTTVWLWLVARAARPAEPRVGSAFPGLAIQVDQKRSDSDDFSKARKAEMTLGSAGLAARATSKMIMLNLCNADYYP